MTSGLISDILSASPCTVRYGVFHMNRKALIITLAIIIFFFSNHQVVAEKNVQSSTPDEQIEARQLDEQAQILAAYFAKYNSPLQYHAQDFIDAAKVYNLDWRMLPAISGVESTFGKFIPGGYNSWGWGVYGTQAIYFRSFKDGIYTVAKGLRENYLDKGLTNPYSINKVYAASPYWGGKVTYFMNDLEKFSQKYQSNKLGADTVSVAKIAAISGQLVLK